MKKINFGLILFFIFSAFVLFLSVRGLPGNPTQKQVNNPEWKEHGPFELSPERGRFALMYSIVENKSLDFSVDLARFTTPDVGYREGKYVSLFAPALSYLVIPGYLVGKILGASQVGAYMSIAFFALLNTLLIYSITQKLGANKIASYISGFVFLFATPAYAYAVNLYQHHVSTFLILLSIYLLMRSRKFINLFIVFFLCAFSLPFDYPNLFLMFPIGIYALGGIISFKKISEKLSFSLNIVKVFSVIAVILPITFFLWFNTQSYGAPFNFLGGSSLSTVKDIDANGKPLKTLSAEKVLNGDKNNTVTNDSGLRLFKTRNLVNGLYTHTISPDRGIIWYTPVMLFAIAGAAMLYKKRNPIFLVLAGVVSMNILLYSLWGDPWGGWAFGSRYLIPAYSIGAIFISIFLTQMRKKYLLMALFFAVLTYSIFVNTLGAITTSTNPPQVEVLNLEKLSGHEQKYTVDRNVDFLILQGTKSFIWNAFAKQFVTPVTYYWMLVTLQLLVVGGVFTYGVIKKGEA